MKKFEYSARIFESNNWLKLHGYAMIRRPGRRKKSHKEHVNLPFPDLIRKKKRFKKKQNIEKFNGYENQEWLNYWGLNDCFDIDDDPIEEM